MTVRITMPKREPFKLYAARPGGRPRYEVNGRQATCAEYRAAVRAEHRQERRAGRTQLKQWTVRDMIAVRAQPMTDGAAAAAAFRGLTGREPELSGAQLEEAGRRGVAQLLGSLK